MHGGGNRIYGLHVNIRNRLFAECEVLDNIRTELRVTIFPASPAGRGG